MPAPPPPPAPWPVSQDLAALAGRARSLSRGDADLAAGLAAALLRIQPVARELERRAWLPPPPDGAAGAGAEAPAALRAWLVELSGAVADAEDLLDELHRRRMAGPGISGCVGAALRGPARELRRLAQRLDSAHDDSERLRLGRAAGCGVRSPNRVTGSVLAERRVFGRDKERDDIVCRLISDGEEIRRSVAPIVAVVGHGGMGKTVVAQCVYNDARIQAYFDLRAWICVWDRLQKRLREVVASKMFLLVLDDVWNDEGKTELENRAVWNKVLAPLSSASIGSKILVTTRMKLVAEVLNATYVVTLDGLKFVDCLLLLKETALGGETMDFPPELLEFGRAIAAKVKGSPLATKVIGEMLRNTRSTRKWRALIDTEICDNIIISSLQLSYQHLPGHLQRCFAYCSIFPTTWTFNRYKLVKMWVALGFVQPPTEGKRLEDLGYKYFDDLLSRSLFGSANKDQQTYYFLDDLMHILAQHFSAQDCMKINEDIPVVIPPTVRHLSISTDYLPQLKSDYRKEIKIWYSGLWDYI
ncbi:putative disease resistance protein RGA3 [Dichanthelium oligosanthes]|uniref:Putative disease resistance protein RGA3 n=1 Tax=Dichanthelium oligosanthes TaxID=888268 RepID=A0A1E5UIG0_9POAL|nr:putative disease resistance protein RGA3 [Dichanthelium oligosanthes]